MESNMKLSPSEAYPESMDFLSRTWCNFAVQTLQPELQDHQSIFLLDDQIKKLGCKVKTSFSKVEKSVKMEEADFKPLPPWKSNDVKSWIWMQQAMHPELNYNSCFRRKWLPWKIIPFKVLSIKKWLKDIKQKRKEEERLQRAEVHAAISVAGVAAALAAIAAESSEKEDLVVSSNKEAAVASAAALVAAQCAQVAEAMGAKREQLSSVIGSAMSSTSASDVLTLTAAAATCNNSFLDSNYFQLPEFPHALRGAAALKARTECKNRLNGSAPVLPIDEGNEDLDFNLEECRSILANGAELHVETPDGNFRVRSVSIILNSQAKVILRMRKLNLLKSKKESIILDMHAELYKDSDSEADTCYLIVLTTNQGVIKLDMGDDYHFYKTWATTISHMLTLSSSLNKYDLPFYKK